MGEICNGSESMDMETTDTDETDAQQPIIITTNVNEDWCAAKFSYKRKATERDDYDFEEDINRARRTRWTAPVQKEIADAKLIGKNQNIVRNILKWLPEWSMREMAAVSRGWRDSVYHILRERQANSAVVRTRPGSSLFYADRRY